MSEIFGVDEELWCSVLGEVLKQLEVRKKERDQHDEPGPATDWFFVPVASFPFRLRWIAVA